MKELIINFWPQLTILFLLIGTQLRDWFWAGHERKININYFNAWILQGIYIWVLYCGGFFKYWGGAQWIYVILIFLFSVATIFVLTNSKFNSKTFKMVESNLIGTLMWIGFYYWAGFFDSLIQTLK